MGCSTAAVDRSIACKQALVFDAEGFAKDLKAARDATEPSKAEDHAHLARIERWTLALCVAGILLSIRGVVSPIAMLCLGYYKFAKCFILAHHSLHGGYGVHRRGWYGKGLRRRIIDWLDWILPEAWVAEHNKEHHYRLQTDQDPDNTQRNSKIIQDMKLPAPLGYLSVFIYASMWKWFYLGPNMLKYVHAERPNAPKKEDLEAPTYLALLALEAVKGSLWHCALLADLLRVFAPMLLLHIFALPVLAGVLQGCGGFPFCMCTFVNMLGAEIVTNLHSFVMVVTDHAGSDLWHFDCNCKADTPEFYLRAVLGSVSIAFVHAGTDLSDFWHSYAGYHPEHHTFPDLSALHYQRLHPHFKRVCASHGVPYVQENVWVRTKKTADVVIGTATNKRLRGMAVDQPDLWMTKL